MAFFQSLPETCDITMTSVNHFLTMLSSPESFQSSETIQILVVEDEYILALNLRESLEALGYGVIAIADTAADAIEKAIELYPDLVLMDIRLQGEVDGIQAAEYIWNNLLIPVIYLTGHSDQSTVERATKTLPFGYILKPVNEQELYVAIKTALSRCEREQFLTTVLRSMGDGVLVVDPQLRIKYLNRVAETLTGWRLADAQDRPLTEVFSLVDERTQLPVESPVAVALQEGSTVYMSDRLLLATRQGTLVPVADSATPLRDPRGNVTGAVMVFRDDTQRRLLEERNLALERSRQQDLQIAELKRLNQLKDDFLATTSHELRTPLSNIKMAIHLLETVLNRQTSLGSDLRPEQPTVTRYLQVLHEQCDQELKLVNDLLDMRAVEADSYPVELISIHLQTWLPHLAEKFQQRCEANRQTLQISIPPTMPPLMSDLNSLTRIMSELLNNACKYTPPGGVIMVAAIATADSIRIWITNSGIEIPLEEQSRVFEPFYRIPKSDRWKHGGTGLGLALVKKMLNYLGASIAVSSESDCTTFTLEFPAIAPDTLTPSQES